MPSSEEQTGTCTCGGVRGGVKDCRGQEAKNQADAAASGPPSRCWRRPSSKAASSISNLSGTCPYTSVPEAAAPHGGRLPRCPLPPRDHGLRRGWTDLPAPQKALSHGPCGRPPRRQVCRVDPAGLTPSCVSPGQSPQLSPLFPAHLAPGHLPRLSTCQALPVPADKEPAQGTSWSS